MTAKKTQTVLINTKICFYRLTATSSKIIDHVIVNNKSLKYEVFLLLFALALLQAGIRRIYMEEVNL